MEFAEHLIFHELFIVIICDPVARAGLPAARNCEPRQAWKGAAAAMDAGAGIGTVWAAFFLMLRFCQSPQTLGQSHRLK